MQAKKIRVGALLSGGGRTLLNILKEIDAGNLPAEVVVVIASRQCKGAERARTAGLDVRVVPRKELPDIDEYSTRINEILDAAGVDSGRFRLNTKTA
jgi:phosphoribosylglycinamide formyltransferase-1